MKKVLLFLLAWSVSIIAAKSGYKFKQVPNANNFIMKKIAVILVLSVCILTCKAQIPESGKVSQEKMLERFLSYIKIESQSVDEPSMTSFPMTNGQKEIARYIYNEVKAFGGKDVRVTLSDDYYVYVDIPSNINKKVPSILFMAHMDVTPEAPGNGIKPMVHRNYDGGDIKLPGGITLSPNNPQCAHLKDLAGKTIVTSDGTTLLGADDKTGCAVLITLIEELVKNPKFKHGRVMVALSQNEDVGKAAMRYEPSVFGDKPDMVIDVDGSTFDQYSIANFTAIGQTYYFKGNKAHPSYGKKEQYADALTAASYFIGLVPPEMNPSAREGTEGYVHCYSMTHPLDESGKPNVNDYVVKVRLRYFDQQEGGYQKKLMEDNLQKVQAAFPFVEAQKTDDQMQYENIAYSMPNYVPELVKKAAHDAGMEMREKYARGGTTSAMMVARFPDVMPGGCDFYSGQNAEHSCYEWACIEELMMLVNATENIITLVYQESMKNDSAYAEYKREVANLESMECGFHCAIQKYPFGFDETTGLKMLFIKTDECPYSVYNGVDHVILTNEKNEIVYVVKSFMRHDRDDADEEPLYGIYVIGKDTEGELEISYSDYLDLERLIFQMGKSPEFQNCTSIKFRVVPVPHLSNLRKQAANGLIRIEALDIAKDISPVDIVVEHESVERVFLKMENRS